MTNPIQGILEKLPGAKKSGNGWMARCPGHDDKKASLAIAEGEAGKVLLHCHAGCSLDTILAGLELDTSDLFVEGAIRSSKPTHFNNSPIVCWYPYRDENGRLLYEVARTEDKQFPPYCKGSFGLNGERRILYRLPELIAADPAAVVFVCEGEKDVDNVSRLGLIATTNTGGAGKWKSDYGYNEFLKGRRVCILPDKDIAGQKHAKQVSSELKGIAATVKILSLPGLDAEKSDVSDWIQQGGTKEKLLALVDEPDIRLVLNRMGDIAPEKTDWLWPNKIPDGALTIISGDPGSGKSFLSLYMAAKITTGSAWPDCPNTIKGSVLIFSDEDHPAKIIRPRLDAHGADVGKVYVIANVKTGGGNEFFDLTRHLAGVEDTLKQVSDCRMIIFDPVTAYLGDTNANSNAAVRSAITPLAVLAAKYCVTVIGINHHNKRADLAYMYRGLGSTAFVAQARSVWGVVPDSDDPETRIFCPIKSNYCVNPTGLKFRIIDGVVTFSPDPWMGRIDDTMGDKESKFNDACDWLRQLLPPGTSESSETIFTQGTEQGFNKKLLYRAKEKLGVKASKLGFGDSGAWFWKLGNNDES